MKTLYLALPLPLLLAASLDAQPAPGGTPGRWSSPGGELSFELPAGWTVHFDPMSWTAAFRYPQAAGEFTQAFMQGRRLPPAYQGQGIRALAPAGVQLLRAQYPLMTPGPIQYTKLPSGLPAATVGFTGFVPQAGGKVRSWVGMFAAGGYSATFLVWGRDDSNLASRIRQMRSLFEGSRGKVPRRDPATETQLVGTWRRFSDHRRKGYLSGSTETLRFLPGNRYHRVTEGTTSVTTPRVGRSGGTTAFIDSGSRDQGTYQVVGGSLVARSSSTGQELVFPIRLGPDGLYIGGSLYVRVP